MNQIDPVIDRGGIDSTVQFLPGRGTVIDGLTFMEQSEDCQSQRPGIELSHDGRLSRCQGLLPRLFLIANPANVPAMAGAGVKGLQGSLRQEHGLPGSAIRPAPIQQDLTFAPKTSEEITPPESGPDNLERSWHFGSRSKPGSRIGLIGTNHRNDRRWRTNVGFR